MGFWTIDQSVLPGNRQKTGSRGGWLSKYVRDKKLAHFMSFVSKDAKILDFGCASGWATSWIRENGWTNVVGLDLFPPADVIGDIHEWQQLGLEPHSFDAIVAFEVVEHGDFAAALRELLKPGGFLLATTPVPHMDWACKTLEAARVLQKRSGEHTNLCDLRKYPGFEVVDHRVKGVVSQWGVLRPSGNTPA